jgi:hypothetical protein
MKSHLLIAAIAVASAVPVSAAELYVAPDGDDANAGTIDAPLASLQAAHDAAAPGDTIYLRGGTYTPDERTVLRKAGTADAWLTLRSYPGELPVIDGRDVPEGNIDRTSTPTLVLSGQYWKVIGPMTVTNGRGTGILVDDGRFLEFDNIESSYNGQRAGTGAHGFMVWIGHDLLFENCDAHHNANHRWRPDREQALHQYQHGDGWRVFTGSNIRLVGCRSWHNLDDNYDILGTESPVEFVRCLSA